MLYLQWVLLATFLSINIWIILADIRERKIPNILLITLIALLPIWYIIFPLGNTGEMIPYIVISVMLLLGGIGTYEENGFLGSGDIKYASIIVLYLAPHSLPLYIGNVGAITLILLVLWIAMILGQLLAMRSLIHRKDILNLLPKHSWKSVLSEIGSVILDWCVIGFFLYIALRNITTLIFEFVPLNRDFYFLLTLLILLIRPKLRYILTEWEHRIYPSIGMLLYYGIVIRDTGISGIGLEEQVYLMGIWRYALRFILLQKIASTVFHLYSIVIDKHGYPRRLSTIPYSLVIFAGFATLVWGHWDLIGLLKE